MDEAAEILEGAALINGRKGDSKVLPITLVVVVIIIIINLVIIIIVIIFVTIFITTPRLD